MLTRPPVWVIYLAAKFWEGCPELPSAFPRNLAETLLWLPHIKVTELPQLTLTKATTFFQQLGIAFTKLPDRPLRGCLAVQEGHGHILLDSTDDDAEKRLTLAHELAHFLRDYEQFRRLVELRLGSMFLEVLDGKRNPTLDERLAGILRVVPVRGFSHLLERSPRNPELNAIREAEDAADRLAFELLAPFAAVSTQPISDATAFAVRLIEEFGLPPTAAPKYTSMLFSKPFSQKNWPAFAKN